MDLLINASTYIAIGTLAAYILGWIYYQVYLSCLGVPWIIQIVPQKIFLQISAGILPLILLAVLPQIIYANDVTINKPPMILYVTAVIYLSLAFYFLINIKIDHELRFSVRIIIYTLLLVSGIASYLWVSFKTQEFLGSKIFFTFGAMIAILAFLSLPAQLGALFAERDLDEKSSSLPKVTLKNGNNPDLRLLLSADNNFYVLDLKNRADGKNSVLILSKEDIGTIA